MARAPWPLLDDSSPVFRLHDDSQRIRPVPRAGLCLRPSRAGHMRGGGLRGRRAALARRSTRAAKPRGVRMLGGVPRNRLRHRNAGFVHLPSSADGVGGHGPGEDRAGEGQSAVGAAATITLAPVRTGRWFDARQDAGCRLYVAGVTTLTDAPGGGEAWSAQPRALIVTIYGLYAREAGGWLSVASLIRLMAELGSDEPAVRSSISRLKQRGVLESRREHGTAGYALSRRGQAILAEGDRRIFERPRASLADGWL